MRVFLLLLGLLFGTTLEAGEYHEWPGSTGPQTYVIHDDHWQWYQAGWYGDRWFPAGWWAATGDGFYLRGHGIHNGFTRAQLRPADLHRLGRGPGNP